MRAARWFTFDGGEAPGLLRLPREATGPVRLALFTGGPTSGRASSKSTASPNGCCSRDVATLAIDIPGAGECPVAFSPAGERPALAALARIRADIRIDPARIGVYGLSFGGHFEAKPPLVKPALKGSFRTARRSLTPFAAANERALPFDVRALRRIVQTDPVGDPECSKRSSRACRSLRKVYFQCAPWAIARDELGPIRDLH